MMIHPPFIENAHRKKAVEEHHRRTGFQGHPMRSPTDMLPYPGQFATVPDLVFVAIPRMDIMAEILVRGETQALHDLYFSVGVIADAVGAAISGNEEADTDSPH
jgi:hypothetical protein